jgi:DNA repair protein RecO (recombination protein O)
VLRVQLQPAYVLHSRPYRNTSLILDVLTEDYGRIALVAKSARGPKSRYRGLLQVFTPMLIDWVGDGDLKTLGNIELQGVSYPLKTQRLFCAYYLNELLVRLLLRDDAVPRIFMLYQQALQRLTSDMTVEIVLREFEMGLLGALGYGVSFLQASDTGNPFDVDAQYQLIPDHGFVRSSSKAADLVYAGAVLIAMEQKDWAQPDVCLAAKKIMRTLLAVHLGAKPLQSRALLVGI